MSRKILRHIHIDPNTEQYNRATELGITFYRIGNSPEGQTNGLFAELDLNEVRRLRDIGIYVRHPTAAEHRLVSTYDLQPINTPSTE